MNPKLEKLRADQELVQRELEQAQRQQRRLKNRIRYISKAHDHRLITHGAAVEHFWPQVKPMTEGSFYDLMEAVLTLPEARAILDAHLPKADGDP